MRLLVVCPSRGRPHRLKECLDSFNRTKSEGTEMLVYVDHADPRVDDYHAMRCQYPEVHFVFGVRKPIPHVFNEATSVRSPYYADCNDDFVFHTDKWDSQLISALESNGNVGAAYGHTTGLPHCMVVSAETIRRLGWWFPLGFQHQYVDDVLTNLFKKAGKLFHVPGVIIEHKHVIWGKAPLDDTYRWVMSEEVKTRDEAAFEDWKLNRMSTDIAKLL